jgi:hypothetical protein
MGVGICGVSIYLITTGKNPILDFAMNIILGLCLMGTDVLYPWPMSDGGASFLGMNFDSSIFFIRLCMVLLAVDAIYATIAGNKTNGKTKSK